MKTAHFKTENVKRAVENVPYFLYMLWNFNTGLQSIYVTKYILLEFLNNAVQNDDVLSITVETFKYYVFVGLQY